MVCVAYICVNVISNHWRPIRRLSLAVGWTDHPVEQNRELAVLDVQNLSVCDASLKSSLLNINMHSLEIKWLMRYFNCILKSKVADVQQNKPSITSLKRLHVISFHC